MICFSFGINFEDGYQEGEGYLSVVFSFQLIDLMEIDTIHDYTD